MPTYRNDGDITYKVLNSDDEVEFVAPGHSVSTFDDPDIPDFTETASTPADNITVDEAPGEDGSFTSAIKPDEDTGQLNLSVQGATWTATVTVQRSFDSGSTWYDIGTKTANIETSYTDYDPDVLYRAGVKYEGYTSGSVVIRLGK